MTLAIEFDSGLGSRDGLAHDEHLDDAPGDDKVDEHGKDGGPFERTTGCFGNPKDSGERCRERCGDHIDEAGETGSRIGTEEFQDETESEEDFDEAEDIPDDLGPAIEGLCAA